MTVDQLRSLGPALAELLDEFADCFGRSEPRAHLGHYVRGQLSPLQRKSVEPIALFNSIAPRTLQEFLNSDVWDPPRARDRVQRIVARDHDDPKAIGILDDSGHPKSGKMTSGVQWQYCGRLGKTANRVVTVQLAFSSFDTCFRTMLDTELFLPERLYQATHSGRARTSRNFSKISKAHPRLGSRAQSGRRDPRIGPARQGRYMASNSYLVYQDSDDLDCRTTAPMHTLGAAVRFFGAGASGIRACGEKPRRQPRWRSGRATHFPPRPPFVYS
jgi:hypothetical protein